MARIRMGLLVLAVAWVASPLVADDRWESSTLANDDTSATLNALTHGARQTHDLQGTPSMFSVPTDVDWMVVETRAHHSYEVRTVSPNVRFRSGFCTLCVEVDRVDGAGNVLTFATPYNPPGPANADWSMEQVVTWIGGSSNQRDFIRVTGDRFYTLGANDQYEIELLDTTYFLPRWNQSGSQFTVLIIQNTSPVGVNGSVRFFDGNGVLLHTEPIAIAPNRVQVVQGGNIAALANHSGSAVIVHTAGYGALAGKAVALEPATGFTFDTQIVPLPR